MPVPARVGGVDLSVLNKRKDALQFGPRPCGRGGFKHVVALLGDALPLVPARVGGVDLSLIAACSRSMYFVPARVGGVDLSFEHFYFDFFDTCPRPCGRGGFKPLDCFDPLRFYLSPPVWAGWI